jgi:hypothetical protein
MTCLYNASPFYKIVTISYQPSIYMSTNCVANWVSKTSVPSLSTIYCVNQILTIRQLCVHDLHVQHLTVG